MLSLMTHPHILQCESVVKIANARAKRPNIPLSRTNSHLVQCTGFKRKHTWGRQGLSMPASVKNPHIPHCTGMGTVLLRTQSPNPCEHWWPKGILTRHRIARNICIISMPPYLLWRLEWERVILWKPRARLSARAAGRSICPRWWSPFWYRKDLAKASL